MEIERINENTVKFFISYHDIEDRGFEREEIWYNRERSEQLFWQMMDEVDDEEDFSIDGPLWIQVQAFDKGLEIIVTKAQVTKNGENIEFQTDNGKTIDLSSDEKLENILDDKFGKDHHKKAVKRENDLSFVIAFQDFEDVIQLSHYFDSSEEGMPKDELLHYQNTYYLYIEFQEEETDDDIKENIISQLLEFGHDTEVTIHYLQEYGKVIFAKDALATIKEHFPA